MSAVLAAAQPSPRFRRWFAWYTRRMFRRSFHRFGITPESAQLLEATREHRGPLIVASNHSSWWDPLVALRFAEAYGPWRTLCAPIEMAQYERFGLLRKLGLFGLDHRRPEALDQMVQHVKDRVQEEPELLVCVTPQGAFTDVRKPIRIRPGVAALAAALPDAQVLCLNGEYTFWQDRKPETYWHTTCCPAPEPLSTSAWHRAIQATMKRGAESLAERVAARKPGAFVSLPEDRKRASGSAVNPFYDAWLRLRGVGSRIPSPQPGSVEGAAPVKGDAS